ncbi:MAG: hypothetical protein EPO24_09560 [Bacteroidetes bacterium]|nr:MAG: hypothetical protein EPO24_09560 [Bacteroidota bacterium]
MKGTGFSISPASKPKIVGRMTRGLPIKLRYTKHFSIDLRTASFILDKQAIRRATKQFLFDVNLPLVIVEDLIVYKLARFDEIDRSDIKSILIRHAKKIDQEYLIEVAKTLEKETGRTDIGKNLKTVLRWMKQFKQINANKQWLVKTN